MKRLLMLGGGLSHAQALRAFARAPLPGTKTLLVAPFANALYAPSLPALVAGAQPRAACEVPLQALAAKAQCSFVAAQAVALDTGARTLTLSDGRVAEYDVLSLDLPPVAARDAVAGAREHALFLQPPEHAATLLDRVFRMASERVLDIVVVGADREAVEIVLALAWRLGGRSAGRAQATAEQARLSLVCGAAGPVPTWPAGARRAVTRALLAARVTVFAETCTEISERHVVLANGARLACDAPLVAAPGRAPAWLASSGLPLDEQGWPRLAPTGQSTARPEVFAARTQGPDGDPRGDPLLALNLRRHLAGGGLSSARQPASEPLVVACGPQRAVMATSFGTLSGGWVSWWQQRRVQQRLAQLRPDAA